MPLWRMRCKDVKETSGVPLVYYARVTSPKKRSGGPAWGPGTASPARARKPLSPFFGGTQFVVEPEASRNTTREPAVPLRRPEKGKPSHFVDWVNRRRYASPNLKRGRQQIFAAPAPRAFSFGPGAGRGAERSPLSRFSRRCPARRAGPGPLRWKTRLRSELFWVF